MLTRHVIYNLMARKLLSPKIIASIKANSLNSPKTAYFYARYVMNGPYPEGEPEIALNPKFSYYYAKEVLGHRFEEGEPTLAHSSAWFGDYFSDVLGGKWPKEMSEALLEARALWGKLQGRE